MLLNDFLHPMMNAYLYGQYQKASNLLFQLNAFLLGYGEGLGDLPKPMSITNDIVSRSFPNRDYQTYYDKYAEVVFKKMGKYIRSVLDSLPKQFYIPEEAREMVES
jgi:hypothetical protein